MKIVILALVLAGFLPPPVRLASVDSAAAAVSDLAVQSIDGATVTLSFTEVADFAGAPANYLVRFQEAPLSVPTAALVIFGSCRGFLTGTQVGVLRTCTVDFLYRLTEGAIYEFQITTFPGSLSTPGPVGNLSNVASTADLAAPSPLAAVPEMTDVPPQLLPSASWITRHRFEEALEDGWHFRDHKPTEKNFQHGHADGDGYGQANYPVTLSPGSGPIQLRRSWDSVDDVTVEMRWQVSPNMDYQTGSHAKKIWFLEAPLVNPIYLALAGSNQLALKTQSTAESGDGAVRMQGGSIIPGRVYDVRVHIRLNSTTEAGASKPDGIATVWLDGERIIHRTDLRFRGEDSPQAIRGRYFRAVDGITGLRWNPTWPGGGRGPREPMWERLYDITVTSGGS